MRSKQVKAPGEPAGSASKPAAPGDVVDAVVLLRSINTAKPPAPSVSKAMAAAALTHAHDATGLRPESAQVFENLHSFSVRAPSRFVDALAQLDDVAQVLPNTLPGSGLIEPVNKKKVRLPD